MMKKALLVAAALVCGSSVAHGQSGPVYWGGGMYPPTMPTPQPYYPSPGIHPAQYPMGGYSPNPYAHQRAVPMNPHMMPVQPNPYYGYNNNGYGINYYEAPNPPPFNLGPMPPSPGVNRPVSRQTGWPIPNAPSDHDEDYVLDQPPGGYVDIRRPLPPVPYHRTPNESCFGSLEYVGMFIRPMRFNGPLVTSGSVLDASPGALGQPGTSVLFGNNATDYGLMSGLRAQLGMFLDDANHYSIEAGGFVIFQNRESFNIAGDAAGNPSISRPVYNIVTGREGAFINTLPGTVTGNLNIDLRSELAGFEINARRHWYVKENLHIDGLLGFRYLRLAERMQIVENLHTIAPAFVTFKQVPIGLGNTLIDDDSFETTNQFFGPQIGGRLSWEQKWFTMTGFAKLALGGTRQSTNIAGSTTVLSPTGAVIAAAPGGILALPTNIGAHNRTVFGILPEFGLNLGVELTQCVRLNLGYSFLLWSHVARPGGQFDRGINPALAPSTPPPIPAGGPQGPIYSFNDELFWAHSFNIGLEFHY